MMAHLVKVLLLSLITSAVYAESMQDMVNFLASDKLEGRKPGKTGNEIATQYLVQKLQKLNLEPIDNSHLQSFTIFTEMVKFDKNQFDVNGQQSDFQPISYSLSGKIKDAELVFAGFGISIPKGDPSLVYDDYAGIDVTDKIVVVLSGDPGIGNKNSKFRHPDYINYRSLFYKLKNAITHGAKGILLVNDPLSISTYPNEEEIFFNGSEGGGSRFSIISGKVSNQFVNNFFPKTKTTLDLQKQIAKTQMPASMALNTKGNLTVNLKKKTGRVSNIVGMVTGSDPVLKNEVIVLGAHMDHLGFGGESSMDPVQTGKIHNGADDNASGTAMVVKLAEDIKNLKPKRTYVFALFNAEEMGLLGSTHFVEMWKGRYEAKYGKIIGMLNYDMVGRYQKDLSISGVDSSKEWKTILPMNTTNFNFVQKKEAVGSSDHAPFINSKIPALFFTTGAHEDYHTSNDTSDKIDFSAMKALRAYSNTFIKNIDKSQNIVFNDAYSTGDSNGRARGYGAHLGCVPQFGQSDDIVGVVCTRASENSPAAQAGIIADDVLVQIGEVEIKTIYDLAFALKYYRAGDEVELGWTRNGTLHKQTVVLAKSRRH